MAENPRRSRGMLSEKGRFCLRICGGSLKLGVEWKGSGDWGRGGKIRFGPPQDVWAPQRNRKTRKFTLTGFCLSWLQYNIWCSTLYPTGNLHS
jgi:hypothetical protein